MAPEYEKLIFTLASVFVGWALAQSTGIAKEYFHRRKVRKYLLEELSELQSELERTLMIYSRELQIYANQGIGNSGPSPLSNHIFKNYYKDALLSLNKDQRISFQLIHTLIEGVNRGMSEFQKITGEIQKKHTFEGIESITEKDGEHWGDAIKCEYGNVATALWHVKFHLSNTENPDLTPLTPSHKKYLKYLESIEKEIALKFSDGYEGMEKLAVLNGIFGLHSSCVAECTEFQFEFNLIDFQKLAAQTVGKADDDFFQVFPRGVDAFDLEARLP